VNRLRRAASTRLKFIQTPFLLSAPQFDKWQLKYDVRRLRS